MIKRSKNIIEYIEINSCLEKTMDEGNPLKKFE